MVTGHAYLFPRPTMASPDILEGNNFASSQKGCESTIRSTETGLNLRSMLADIKYL